MDHSQNYAGHRRKTSWNDWLVLALLIGFPSTGFVQKYAGIPGVAAYLAGVAVVVGVTGWFGRWFARPVAKYFQIIAVAVIVALLAAFVWLHPFEDGKGPGKSSDRDEALEIAVSRMAEGQTPYYPPGNPDAGPLSVLPGSILAAAPFVALGKVGYQNVAWLAVLLFALKRRFQSEALALGLLLVPLAISPAAQYEFVSGGDLIANGIFVALLLLFAVETWSSSSTSNVRRWLACVLLGIGLASRPNFLLLTPLFCACVWRAQGFRLACIAALWTGLTSVAVISPFYWHDPARFTPLKAKQKLAVADAVLPGASHVMIGLTLLAAVIAAGWLWRKRDGDSITDFCRACALVTLTPMLGAVAMASWVHARLDFEFMRDRFGLMYVFFALFGWGGGWFRHPSSRLSRELPA
jgi:uncharacterized membrane protein